jgi:Transposase DDE domain
METMPIVTTHVTQAPNDKKEMEPALTNLKQLPQGLGTVTDLIADNGYFSGDNVMLCQKTQVTSYIAANREKHHPPVMDRFREPPPLHDDATTLDTMKHRLKTKSGKAVYVKCKTTIEPVFSIIKSVLGFSNSCKADWQP